MSTWPVPKRKIGDKVWVVHYDRFNHPKPSIFGPSEVWMAQLREGIVDYAVDPNPTDHIFHPSERCFDTKEDAIRNIEDLVNAIRTIRVDGVEN